MAACHKSRDQAGRVAILGHVRKRKLDLLHTGAALAQATRIKRGAYIYCMTCPACPGQRLPEQCVASHLIRTWSFGVLFRASDSLCAKWVFCAICDSVVADFIVDALLPDSDSQRKTLSVICSLPTTLPDFSCLLQLSTHFAAA